MKIFLLSLILFSSLQPILAMVFTQESQQIQINTRQGNRWLNILEDIIINNEKHMSSRILDMITKTLNGALNDSVKFRNLINPVKIKNRENRCTEIEYDLLEAALEKDNIDLLKALLAHEPTITDTYPNSITCFLQRYTQAASLCEKYPQYEMGFNKKIEALALLHQAQRK